MSHILRDPAEVEDEGSNPVVDKMQLRELELQTRYELKYLSDSFTDLKSYVHDALEQESDRFDVLNKKVSWLSWIILAQLAGLDIDLLLKLLKALPI